MFSTVSLVFSFRNEEAALPELIRRCRIVLSTLRQDKILVEWELVFVDDASTDRSRDILLEADKYHQDIRILSMSRPFGVTPCVMAGLARAKGDVLIYMDADLQDPPEIIPLMLAAVRNDPTIDIVHTVRRSRQGESAFKLHLTQLGYWILNRFSNTPIPAEAGDFKLLTRRAVNQILRFKENRPFMRGIVSWIGFKQIFIPYDRAPRYAGNTKFPVTGHAVIKNFLSSAVVNFSSAPLQIAVYCGLFAILATFGLTAHVIWAKATNNVVPGWTAIMISVLFIGGVQLFCLGIIGLYLYSVHEQSKNRPGYIINTTYGLDPE